MAEYGQLMESLSRRRQLSTDELLLIAEHEGDPNDPDGLLPDEEDLLDMALLGEEDEEWEDDADEEQLPTAG